MSKPEKAQEIHVAADPSTLAIVAAATQLGVHASIYSATLLLAPADIEAAGGLQDLANELLSDNPLTHLDSLTVNGEQSYEEDEWSIEFFDKAGESLGVVWSPPITIKTLEDVEAAGALTQSSDAPIGDGIGQAPTVKAGPDLPNSASDGPAHDEADVVHDLESYIAHLARNVPYGKAASVTVYQSDERAFKEAEELSHRWRQGDVKLSEADKLRFCNFYVSVVGVEEGQDRIEISDVQGTILATTRHHTA